MFLLLEEIHHYSTLYTRKGELSKLLLYYHCIICRMLTREILQNSEQILNHYQELGGVYITHLGIYQNQPTGNLLLLQRDLLLYAILLGLPLY